MFSVAAVVGCNSTETPTQGAHEQGERAFDKGELDLAINCFSEAIRLDPNNVMAYRGVPFPIILSRVGLKGVEEWPSPEGESHESGTMVFLEE